MTTRAAGRTLQRNIESARPASSATLITYTTCRDATDKPQASLGIYGLMFALAVSPRATAIKAGILGYPR